MPSTDIKKKGVILRVIPNRVRLWCLFAYPSAAQHPVLSSKKEKMMIMFYDKLYGGKEELLNKRNEICFNCRHARNSENTIEFWGKWGREYEARLEDDDNNGSVEETAE